MSEEKSKPPEKPTVTITGTLTGGTLAAWEAHVLSDPYSYNMQTFRTNTDCFPVGRYRTNELLNASCPECGHGNWLHSDRRACIGCEMIHTVIRVAERFERERHGST